jgi:hypothetical protein
MVFPVETLPVRAIVAWGGWQPLGESGKNVTSASSQPSNTPNCSCPFAISSVDRGYNPQ